MHAVNSTANGASDEDVDPYSGTTPRPDSGQNTFGPIVSAPPAVTHSTASCAERSRSVSWELGRIVYNVFGQGISFPLTNKALNYTTRCSIQDLSDRIRYETPIWRNCSSYDSSRATYPYDGVYTEVLYGGLGDVVGVNQTWYCDDGGKNQAYVPSFFLFFYFTKPEQKLPLFHRAC